MKVQLTSTTKIVELVVDGARIPARIWEGTTSGGIACHAYITRIACPLSADSAEFDRDLQEHAPPTTEIAAIPLLLIL